MTDVEDKLAEIGKKVAVTYGLVAFVIIMLPCAFMLLLGSLAGGLVSSVFGLSLFLSAIVFVLIIVGPFIFSLRFFGKKMALDLYKEKSLIYSSAKFSFGVNIVIWSLMILVVMCFYDEEGLFVASVFNAVLLILLLGTVTTLTIGLFISLKVKKKVALLRDNIIK